MRYHQKGDNAWRKSIHDISLAYHKATVTPLLTLWALIHYKDVVLPV